MGPLKHAWAYLPLSNSTTPFPTKITLEEPFFSEWPLHPLYLSDSPQHLNIFFVERNSGIRPRYMIHGLAVWFRVEEYSPSSSGGSSSRGSRLQQAHKRDGGWQMVHLHRSLLSESAFELSVWAVRAMLQVQTQGLWLIREVKGVCWQWLSMQ